jgi:hypothetical protein
LPRFLVVIIFDVDSDALLDTVVESDVSLLAIIGRL